MTFYITLTIFIGRKSIGQFSKPTDRQYPTAVSTTLTFHEILSISILNLEAEISHK